MYLSEYFGFRDRDGNERDRLAGDLKKLANISHRNIKCGISALCFVQNGPNKIVNPRGNSLRQNVPSRCPVDLRAGKKKENVQGI